MALSPAGKRYPRILVPGPVFVHDCEVCEYLGSTVDEGERPYDLYVCGGKNVVARYSDDGPDYHCGLVEEGVFTDRYPLSLGVELAVESGALKA